MRRQEDYREDTIRRLHEEKRLEANMSNEERISEKRFIRRTMMEQKEKEMEEAILKVKRTSDFLTEKERIIVNS